jgi:putative tryptophan/tyrosine transport system substrate-binding protein
MRRREFVSLVGRAVAWPLAARAESTGNKYRLALLAPFWRREGMKGFFDDLSRAGYVEGQNLVAEFLSTEGKSELRSEIARDAVRRNPDAILVFTGPLTQHVKDVTATIPIACITTDPIALGLTTSLARPSANVTGVVVDAGIEGWGKKWQGGCILGSRRCQVGDGRHPCIDGRYHIIV